MHFERMAAEYARARPPYPREIFHLFRSLGVIGPGLRVLEVGAGAGLATRSLVLFGSEVVALEPGAELAAVLRRDVPDTSVVVGRLEDTPLPHSAFDCAVAATSLHWVDLSVGLPRLHAALRPSGWLAVLRTVFGDDTVATPFRDRVALIVAEREQRHDTAARPPERPSMAELSAGGWFAPVRTERLRWSVDLTTEQVRRLFRTFSDWTADEVDTAARAADECGGLVTEYYESVLHLLRRRD